jgi:hypothetical protein
MQIAKRVSLSWPLGLNRSPHEKSRWAPSPHGLRGDRTRHFITTKRSVVASGHHDATTCPMFKPRPSDLKWSRAFSRALNNDQTRWSKMWRAHVESARALALAAEPTTWHTEGMTGLTTNMVSSHFWRAPKAPSLWPNASEGRDQTRHRVRSIDCSPFEIFQHSTVLASAYVSTTGLAHLCIRSQQCANVRSLGR